ncbi:MAG: hypothetical protein AAGK02_07100 [Pseudomonadota bacterium]
MDDEKGARARKRADNPHEWADSVENELSARSILPVLATILGLFALANVWLLWNERNAMKDRLDDAEFAIETVETYLENTSD